MAVRWSTKIPAWFEGIEGTPLVLYRPSPGKMFALQKVHNLLYFAKCMVGIKEKCHLFLQYFAVFLNNSYYEAQRCFLIYAETRKQIRVRSHPTTGRSGTHCFLKLVRIKKRKRSGYQWRSSHLTRLLKFNLKGAWQRSVQQNSFRKAKIHLAILI